AGALPACKGGDPKTAKYWVEKIQNDKTEGERKNDLTHLNDLLKTTREAKAVEVLGNLGDKSAAAAMVEAVDLSHGTGADKATQAANHANKAIAEALG